MIGGGPLMEGEGNLTKSYKILPGGSPFHVLGAVPSHGQLAALLTPRMQHHGPSVLLGFYIGFGSFVRSDHQ